MQSGGIIKGERSVGKAIITVALLFMFLCSSVSLASGPETREPECVDYQAVLERQEFKDLNGKRFGAQTGSTFDRDVMKWFPDAKISYYNSLPDLAVALKTGKIDAFPADVISIEMMIAQTHETSITMLEPFLDIYSCGFVFPKNEKGKQIRDSFDEFMIEIEENGQLESITDKWVHAAEEDKTMPDYKSLSAENGTLIFATEAGYPPFDYMRSGEVVGMELELAIDFCREYGYGIEIIPMSFEGILPAIQAGKVDFSASGFAITEERKESIYFSRPYYTSGTKITVRADENAGGESFITELLDNIQKTFIREERWKLFVDGSIITLVITIMSTLFGTLLGFSVYLLCRSRGVIVNTVTSGFTWLLQGMPMVVLLMVLYYVVFGNTSLGGTAISIVAFSLVFGVSVLEILKNGVSAVDKGQTEAASALGCTPHQTFFDIILPQALPFMTGPYKGEIISLVKATSIVGYIAVLDLAKMGDLVRSRTYEAFFPLISVMVIYFILEGVMGLLVDAITGIIDPRKNNTGKLMKGVHRRDQA